MILALTRVVARKLGRGRKIQDIICVRANGGLDVGLRESKKPKRLLSFGIEQQNER